MPGICDQRHRAGQDAVCRFDDYEGRVEHDPDQECPAEVCGRMAMAAMVVMVMRMIVTMAM